MKNALRSALFTVLVPGMVAIYLPLLIEPHRALPRSAIEYLGVPLAVAGAIGYLVCAAEFLSRGKGTPAIWFTRHLGFLIGEEPATLVRSSLYGRTRNPMYVSVILILLGEALCFSSLRLLIYTAVVWVAFHLVIVFGEERHLRRTQGETYLRYCRNVPRWALRLRKLPGDCDKA